MENDPSASASGSSVAAKPCTNPQKDDENDKFFKKPIRFPADRDFRTTPKYNDQQSYVNQRNHLIGLGVFNTEDIEDLPPRHREKVRNVYKKLAAFANAVLPQDVIDAHGGSVQVSDLLNLKRADASKSESQKLEVSDLPRPPPTFSRENTLRLDQRDSVQNNSRQSNDKKETVSDFCNNFGQSEHFRRSSPIRTSAKKQSDSKPPKRIESHACSGSELKHDNEYVNLKSGQNKESSYPHKQEENHKNSYRSSYKNIASDEKYGSRPESRDSRKSDSELLEDRSESIHKDEHMNSRFHTKKSLYPGKKAENLAHYDGSLDKNKPSNPKSITRPVSRNSFKSNPEFSKDGCKSNHGDGYANSKVFQNAKFSSFQKKEENNINCDRSSYKNEASDEKHGSRPMSRNSRQSDSELPKDRSESKHQYEDLNSKNFHTKESLYPDKKEENGSNYNRFSHKNKPSDPNFNTRPGSRNSLKSTEFSKGKSKPNHEDEHANSKSFHNEKYEKSLSPQKKKESKNWDRSYKNKPTDGKYGDRQASRNSCKSKSELSKQSESNQKDEYTNSKSFPTKESSYTVDKKEVTNYDGFSNPKSITRPESQNSCKSNPEFSKYRYKSNQEDEYANSQSFRDEKSLSSQKKEESKSKPSDGKYGNKLASRNSRKSDSKLSKESESKQNDEYINSMSFHTKNCSYPDQKEHDSNYDGSSDSKFNTISVSRNSCKSNPEFSKHGPKSNHEDEYANSKSFRDEKSSSPLKREENETCNRFSYTNKPSDRKYCNRPVPQNSCKSDERDANDADTKFSKDNRIVSHDRSTFAGSSKSKCRTFSSVSSDNFSPKLDASNDERLPGKRYKEHEDFLCEDSCFSISVRVSENSKTLLDTFWKKFFQDALEHCSFTLECCCMFSESIYLNFKRKTDASLAFRLLLKLKKGKKDPTEPYLIFIGDVKVRSFGSCSCRKDKLDNSNKVFEKTLSKSLNEYRQNVEKIQGELNSIKSSNNRFSERRFSLEETLSTLRSMELNFNKICEKLKQEAMVASKVSDAQRIQKNFVEECSSFENIMRIHVKNLKDDLDPTESKTTTRKEDLKNESFSKINENTSECLSEDCLPSDKESPRSESSASSKKGRNTSSTKSAAASKSYRRGLSYFADNNDENESSNSMAAFHYKRPLDVCQETKTNGKSDAMSCNSEPLVTRHGNKNEDRQKYVLSSIGPSVLQHVVNAAYSEFKESKEQRIDPQREIKTWKDQGFFVKVNVSEDSNGIEHWETFFKDTLKHSSFSLDYCCTFTESLILNFQSKEAAISATHELRKVKKRHKDVREAHITSVGNMKTHIVRPCNCENNMVTDCKKYFEEFSLKYSKEHQQKMIDIQDELKSLKNSKSKYSHEHFSNLSNALSALEDMETVFTKRCKRLVQEALASSNILEIRRLKKNFSRECNSFQRCLPIYSKKVEILEMVRFHPVSVVVADTGSGKSTQLAEYLLQTQFEESGIIICTQPRKIAAITVANYVCGQMGCPVGKLVGYDAGIEKKYDKDITKIIYMTDYALLKECLRNKRLKGISCVIVDEAHERTLYTDILLGLLKECVEAVPSLRIVITSATIDPTVFVNFFNLNPQKTIVSVPGRTYPVEEIWLEDTVEIGWNYVEKCVKTAVKIHLEEKQGDILVFLTSPAEIDEAILLFKELCPEFRTSSLLSLHGKTDLQEQLLIFQTTSTDRKVIFATNAAETSLTIPGIRYVIDSGMVNELVYFHEKNKSCLMITFINKSSAEQRKGRAGRTQPGVCYRMYSQENFEKMPDRSCPEMLKTNLQKALMKICEFGIKPEKFDFVESPPVETILRSLESLEQLSLIKNSELTELGRKVVKLPVDPRLSKLVLLGIKAKIGYEAAIIAALVSEAGRLFLRFKDIRVEADEKKLQFCQTSGDLCTYLDVYKKWMEIAKSERYNWCVRNYINSRAMNSAAKTLQEILICLHQELSMRVTRRYNNTAFEYHFEGIVFECFSDNLCTYSGHQKLGYSSPYFKEMLFIHPSSSLKYLGANLPEFLVYTNLLQTSRNFLLDVTPVKRETIDKAYQKGTFKLQVDMIKCLQILPKVLGPFGESVLVRHILGKAGSKIVNLEATVEKLTNSKNFKIDVSVDKGTVVIYTEKRFHDRVSNYIYDMVNKAHGSLAKEEDIVKMSGGFSYFCLGAGGKISDLILPGEFKEVIVDNLRKQLLRKVESSIREFGDLQSFRVTDTNHSFCRINATYLRVLDAKSAMRELSQDRAFTVKSHVYVQENDKSLPLYRLKISWCRSPSTGTGWVEFFSSSDCIMASGRLTQSPLYIENNRIRFAPSSLSTTEIEMSNLPAIVNEEMIKERIMEALEDYVKVKTIYIRRRKIPLVTEQDISEVKKQLTQAFGRFTPASKLVIEVTYPNARSNTWDAMAYFECRNDGERALGHLDGNLRINSFPAEIKPALESHLVCKKHVFQSVEEEVTKLCKSKKGTRISSEVMADTTMVKINFACKRIEDLSVLRLQLIRLIQGVSIECFGRKEYSYLFTVTGERFIQGVQRRTKTLISLDNLKKSISIHGSKKNCSDAELMIRTNVSNHKQLAESKRVFDLKNSNIPSGFLKSLYAEYGLDLLGLVKEFELDDIQLDVIKGSLALYGSKGQLKKAEDCLEDICDKLHINDQTSKEDSEICAICLDPVPYDFYRLENCGHAFCKSCLLLQIQSKIVPVVCVQENCGKDLFLVDIRRILALGGNSVKQSFYIAALQQHVNSNMDKINYCPSPDCDMVYRVSSKEGEFHCPSCDVDICTQCQTPLHYGMSCEMFQNCAKDEDYSLKIWMQENENLRKQCPKCKVIIEKESGCNHMECSSCHSHFCWLCLETFAYGDLVYDHMPYCPKNN